MNYNSYTSKSSFFFFYILLFTCLDIACKEKYCDDAQINELYNQIGNYSFIGQSNITYMGRTPDPLFFYKDKKDSRIGYEISSVVGNREIVSIMDNAGISKTTAYGDSISITSDIEIVNFLSSYEILKVKQMKSCLLSIIYTTNNIYIWRDNNSPIKKTGIHQISDCQVEETLYRLKKENIDDFRVLCRACTQ